MCNTKDDIKLTDAKSTREDAERSKREDVFVIKGTPECLVQDAIPSEACKEYHKNSYIQINGQLRRCGALNTDESQ
jgi:hypothetical protein